MARATERTGIEDNMIASSRDLVKRSSELLPGLNRGIAEARAYQDYQNWNFA
jgi:hypothetical protein